MAATTSSVRVFLENDPRQLAFRLKLARLDDLALVELENDLARYAQTGCLSKDLQRLIDDPQKMQVA